MQGENHTTNNEITKRNQTKQNLIAWSAGRARVTIETTKK